MRNIPFNTAYFTGNELKYVKEALDMGSITGDGHFTSLVASFLEQRFSINKILMTTSGTHALEMAMMLIGLNPDDEVIMPSFTFPSTANAVMIHGGKPVFAEISKDTLNINPDDIEKRITKNTKAIIPVHYGGVGCDMDEIMDLAKKYNLFVIEDAAQGLNAKYKNKFLGSLGHIGCYSFHGTKNYICGEGGAISFNCDDKELIEKAEIIRQKGTNRSKFIRGEINKYSWVSTGSSYSPSDILMAILYAQLQQSNQILHKRKKIVDFYTSSLKEHVQVGKLKGILRIPKYCESNYHLFYVTLNSEKAKKIVLDKLIERGIHATIHFVPLHSSAIGLKLGYQPNSLCITEEISRTLIRLPLYTDMTGNEAQYVIDNFSHILKEI